MIFMLLLYGFPNYISFDLIKFDPKEFCESILIQKTMMQKKKPIEHGCYQVSGMLDKFC